MTLRVARHIALLAFAIFAGCAGRNQPPPGSPPIHAVATADEVQTQQRWEVPASGPATDVSFPKTARTKTASGLEVNTVQWQKLPVVYLKVIVHSGAERDPKNMPGVAHLVGAMLKEGTKQKTSAELAEEIEFLGASLSVADDEENVVVTIRSLAEHLDTAMELLAEVVLRPSFDKREFDKLKRRELNRLKLQESEPRFLAKRALFAELYGSHPYAVIDTNVSAIKRIKRSNLVTWHRRYFVPGNATLIAVGDVSSEQVERSASKAFAKWRPRKVAPVEYPDTPKRSTREVIIVDRPESDQSVIYIGNLALERASDDYVRLRVANQVLGGSASSRLFMDLREKRSLTYGAYSHVSERLDVGPFVAVAQVRSAVTGEAVKAFFEHLYAITKQAAPADELEAAKRFLSDRFPLQIDTPQNVAELVAEQRIYGLPDDYWNQYRSGIRKVSTELAWAAAKQYIDPDECIVVIVGKASELIEPLSEYGEVTVYDKSGKKKSKPETAVKE